MLLIQNVEINLIRRVRTMTKNFLTYNNITKPLQDWAAEAGINKATLHSRIYKMKWPVEKALQQDVAAYNQKMELESVSTAPESKAGQSEGEALIVNDQITGYALEVGASLVQFAGKDLSFNIAAAKYHLLQDLNYTLHKIEKAFEALLFKKGIATLGCGRAMLNPDCIISGEGVSIGRHVNKGATDIWDRVTSTELDNLSWYDIPGFSGAYQIAKGSNIRSIDRVIGSRFHKGRKLLLKNGGVTLNRNSESKWFSIKELEQVTSDWYAKNGLVN